MCSKAHDKWVKCTSYRVQRGQSKATRKKEVVINDNLLCFQFSPTPFVLFSV